MRVKGQREGSRGLVGMVRVSSWKVHYVYENPHKNSTRMSVITSSILLFIVFTFMTFAFICLNVKLGTLGGPGERLTSV